MGPAARFQLVALVCLLMLSATASQTQCKEVLKTGLSLKGLSKDDFAYWSALSVMLSPIYEVTLNIILDRSPAVYSNVYIYRIDPLNNKKYLTTTLWTAESEMYQAICYLPKGQYEAILHSAWQKFFAIYPFSVDGDSTFQINVTELTYPIMLKVINPLKDRELVGGYFTLIVPSHLWLGEYDFYADTENSTMLYLQKDTTYSFGFSDYTYILFTKNVTVDKPGMEVQFDASNTGIWDLQFVLSTGGSKPPGWIASLIDDQLPEMTGASIQTEALIFFDFYSEYQEWYGPVAMTVGTYNFKAHVFNYDFRIENVTINHNATTTIFFGGDLTGSIKATNRYMERRIETSFQIRLQDSYGHDFIGANLITWNGEVYTSHGFDYMAIARYTLFETGIPIERNKVKWITFNSETGVIEVPPTYVPYFKEPVPINYFTETVYDYELTLYISQYPPTLTLSTSIQGAPSSQYQTYKTR